jgi:hypothetical protein
VKKTILMFALLSSFAGAAMAQDPTMGMEPAKKMRLGAGVVLGLPIGDWGDFVNFSIGVLADFDWVVTPALSVTGRAGYIHHLTDIDDASFSTIPLWGGVKYYFAPAEASTRFFAAGEAGLTFNHASFDFGGGTVSDTETDLGVNLGGGIELGAISIRANLTFFDIGNAGDSFEIMASAAYYFLSF